MKSYYLKYLFSWSRIRSKKAIIQCRNSIFAFFLISGFLKAQHGQQLSLPTTMKMAEEYLYLDYIKSIGDSLYFLSKDIHDQGPLQDTVIIREAVYFQLYFSNEIKKQVHQEIVSQLDHAEHIIVITLMREGKEITPMIYASFRWQCV